MDINREITLIKPIENEKNAEKRKANYNKNSESDVKKTKLQISLETPEKLPKPADTFTHEHSAGTINLPLKINCHQSPKKRLEIAPVIQNNAKEQFIYGNYNKYYGYRNKGNECIDKRLEVFAKRVELFENKQLLDIGCNSGLITMEVAKRFDVKSIVGLDIDRTLINQANKALLRQKKALPFENNARCLHKFPYNVSFVHGNYVLRDDVLLEIEHAQFDVILCLSITKWIHLNFGDIGLKQAFRRMYLQLRSGGKLILEAQPYRNYGRRKKMTV
uniref:RNA methyltransferase n=1 Tax=Ceratitis capitata TaxID=7213 RepID=W8AU42_CERCA